MFAPLQEHPLPCIFVVAGFYFRIEEASRRDIKGSCN